MTKTQSRGPDKQSEVGTLADPKVSTGEKSSTSSTAPATHLQTPGKGSERKIG